MPELNGTPQPDKHAALGGQNIGGGIPPRHPGGRSCAPVLLAMLTAPWLLDLLLTGSQAIS